MILTSGATLAAMPPELDLTIAAKLRAVGQRYTPNRRKLVDILAAAGQPLAIPDILTQDSDLPQSSAYRNLAVLEQAHVVRRVVTDEEFAHYELAEDLTEHHHHLICSNCGRVEDVTIPPRFERNLSNVLDEVAEQAGFSAVSHRLDLVGLCRACG